MALRANDERDAFLLKLTDALRPISDPSDSPEEVNNAKTNANDGLNARQRARARSGQ